jgi:DNA-binding transcriptional regulator YhcF (GntR family)
VDFVLKRKGGVPLHDQLLAQLELRILTGVLAPGQRLPSVRALARRLGLHANTVSSAYRDLETAGHVELRRGAGVYVRSGAPASLEDAHGLDELIRLALSAAFRKGHSGAEIRAAVERWLRAAPPERVVVVDPRRRRSSWSCTRSHVDRRPRRGLHARGLEPSPASPPGAAGRCLIGRVARAARRRAGRDDPGRASEENEKAVMAVPVGGTVLLVSSSPILLQIAQGRISGLRGDELLVEARLVSRRAEWRRLLPAADLVLADALASGVVREARARRLRELRLVGERDLARLRKALGRSESAA